MLQINRVRRESFTPTHQDRYSGGIWNKVCVPVRIKPSIFGGVMRNAWILAGIAAWLLGAGIPQAQAQSTAARRPIVREIKGPERKGGLDVYHIDSDYQASPASLYVLLPDRLDPAKRYKVLYVLPAWGPSNDGILEARKLNLANKYDVICVGPDYVECAGTPTILKDLGCSTTVTCRKSWCHGSTRPIPLSPRRRVASSWVSASRESAPSRNFCAIRKYSAGPAHGMLL